MIYCGDTKKVAIEKENYKTLMFNCESRFLYKVKHFKKVREFLEISTVLVIKTLENGTLHLLLNLKHKEKQGVGAFGKLELQPVEIDLKKLQ